MSYTIRGEFLSEVREFFVQMPEIATKAASLALNQVAERQAVPMIRREAEAQIAFPKGYLDNQDRLGITRKSHPGRLEVIITARDRATSLARFAPAQTPKNTRGRGVTVQVKKGRAKTMKKAFLVNLRNGNVGLATRDPKLIARAYKPVVLARGVYLLYAPSVDQVVKTVAVEALPDIGNLVSKEFFRQFTRLSRG